MTLSPLKSTTRKLGLPTHHQQASREKAESAVTVEVAVHERRRRVRDDLREAVVAAEVVRQVLAVVKRGRNVVRSHEIQLINVMGFCNCKDVQ